MITNLDIVYLLDSSYETIGVIDEYYSLIWTVRFRGAGEAQLVLPATRDYMNTLQIGMYLMIPSDKDSLMRIDTIQISDSFEEGAKLTITAYGLEYILSQRVAKRINAAIKANPALIVKGLLNDNAINADVSARNFPGLKFGAFVEDVPEAKFLTYYIDGENVYELVNSFCDHADIGWRIKPDYDSKGMIFETYRGKDRSYNQTDNPWVVFSPSYDNLISSNFIKNESAKYNVVMYKGPDAYYSDGQKLRDEVRGFVNMGRLPLSRVLFVPRGLARREIFYEDNTSWNDPDSSSGDLYSQSAMEDMVKGNAKKALTDSIEKDAFEGEVDTLRQFTYGVDFEIGDICQMSTDYGIDALIRVEEVVQSKDNEGYKLTPTFVILNFEAGEQIIRPPELLE